MVRLSKRRKRFFAGLLTAIAVGLAFCLIAHFNLFHGIHLQSSDFLFRATDSGQVADSDSQIVVVTIDDASLDQLGRFSSWPRAYHAQLIDILSEKGARIIAFDILFSEPSPDDDELVAAIEQAGNVILPFAVTVESQEAAAAGKIISQEELVKPLESLEQSALATGQANMIPDEDGVVRRLPLLIPRDDVYEPALALAVVAKYLRRPEIIEAPVDENALPLAGRSIPLDDAHRMLINYSGSPAPMAFQAVSYVDVLENKVAPEAFEDKIVLVGITALGFGDNFWTPMERIMSGVEIHAQAMHTILNGDFLISASSSMTNLSILLLALICGLIALRFRVLWSAVLTIFLGGIYLLAAFLCFDHGILVDMLYPPMALVGGFLGVNLFNVASERIEKGEIARTFGQYVSPSVATKILNAVGGGSLKLGGEECTATVLFADVRNFTKATLENDGMVNKFGGDSIMAVWNVPINYPEHALAATRAAVTAQVGIRELQAKALHLPKLKFGIGINTGNAVAGNMGSAYRLEYSVIGDTVNTAARLSSVTPGGKVWIGAETFNLLKNRVEAVPLEPLKLKGKAEPLQAYEVVNVHSQPMNLSWLGKMIKIRIRIKVKIRINSVRRFTDSYHKGGHSPVVVPPFCCSF
jgi:adenylate cyclase